MMLIKMMTKKGKKGTWLQCGTVCRHTGGNIASLGVFCKFATQLDFDDCDCDDDDYSMERCGNL